MPAEIDALINSLSKLKPVPRTLRVTVDDDDTPRKVAVPNVRRRWERVARVLEGLKWRSVEAVDGQGATLAVVQCEDDPPEDEAPTGKGITLRELELIQQVRAAFVDGARLTREAMSEALKGQRDANLAIVAATRATAEVAQATSRHTLRMVEASRETAQAPSADDDGLGTMLSIADRMLGREAEQKRGTDDDWWASAEKRREGKGPDRREPPPRARSSTK